MLFSDYLKRMDNLGVYLPQLVFSNGQCNVALSRAGLPQETKAILIDLKDFSSFKLITISSI